MPQNKPRRSGDIFYGYRMVNGEIQIDEKCAGTVRKIFHLYVIEERSSHYIAEHLTRERVRSATGNPSWHHSSVIFILRKSAYTGENGYPPMIEHEIFQQAKEKLEKTGRRRIKRSPHGNREEAEVLFPAGQICCGVCGRKMRRYGSLVQRKGEAGSIRLASLSERNYGWFCSHEGTNAAGSCREVMIGHRKLEQEVWRIVSEKIDKLEQKQQYFLWKQRTRQREAQERTNLKAALQYTMENGEYSRETVKALIYHWAKEQHHTAKADRNIEKEKQLLTALKTVEKEQNFSQLCEKRIIEAIVVYPEGRIVLRYIAGSEEEKGEKLLWK